MDDNLGARRARALSANQNFMMLVEDDPSTPGPRLHVAGDLDLANLSRFRRLLGRLIAGRPSTIEIDISRLELVETITAAALLRAQQDASAEGIELRIAGASASIDAMLRLAEARLARP